MEIYPDGVWSRLVLVAVCGIVFSAAASGQGGTEPCDTAQFARIQRDAARGVAKAQTELAGDYAEGRCITKDYAQAAIWYRRAAEQGYAEAEYQLAMYLMEGKEVTLDETAAAKWLTRAAEQNHAEAQYALGVLYVQGRGVKKDAVQGYTWIRVSAPASDQHVQDVLAEITKTMSRADVERAETAAAAWTRTHPIKKSQDTTKK